MFCLFFLILPPEHHIFNPADKSGIKSPCRPSTSEHTGAEMKIQETSPGSEIIHSAGMPTVKMSEESRLPKKGREKLACLLADLLSFPGTDSQPEAKTHRLNLYESMSPAFGNELNLAPAVPLQDSQQGKRAVIYENCLKCQGEHCQPPPRAVPAQKWRNRNISPLKSFPTWLHLKKGQEHPANEELLYQALNDSSQSVDGQCWYEEINGSTVTSEGKRPPSTVSSSTDRKLQILGWFPLFPHSVPFEDLFLSRSLCFSQ